MCEAIAALRAAINTYSMRDAALTRTIDDVARNGAVGPCFKRVIIGGGLAAAALATRLCNAHPREFGNLKDIEVPATIGVAEASEPWQARGELRMGQPLEELASPLWARNPDTYCPDPSLHAPGTDFVPSSAFAATVATTRATSPLRYYMGAVTKIRQEGGIFELTVTRASRQDTIMIRAEKVEVVTGPGPSRSLDSDLRPPHFDDLRKQRLILTGEEHLDTSTPRDAVDSRVLVSGGGATGAWNVEQALRSGAKVDWLGRTVATPRTSSASEEFSRLQSELTTATGKAADSINKRLQVLRTFDLAWLPRNLHPNGPFHHPKVSFRFGALESVGTRRNGQRVQLLVTATDYPGLGCTYDRLIVSHGQDNSRNIDLLRDLRGVRPLTITDEMIGLEAFASPGVRLLGAAAWASDWSGHMPLEVRETYRSARDAFAHGLPKHSNGVYGSINGAVQTIALVS